MARVISIHEYDLKPGVDLAALRARYPRRGAARPFRPRGPRRASFLRGIKGARRDAYSAVWVFESREVWEKLWGTPEAPRPPAEYPKEWAVWENDILAPFLVRHPDTTRFTSYEEL